MKSIFELENRLHINKEFKKIIHFLYENEDAIIFFVGKNKLKSHCSIIDILNKKIFLKWKYRDTFLNVEEYFEHIGIDYEQIFLYRYECIEMENFLYFLEFLENMFFYIEQDNTLALSIETKAIIDNIPIILEKMNYKINKIDDKYIITKRNADVDSILTIVPENLVDLLLQYNDIKIKSSLSLKKRILKELDLYIEKNINIKSFDKELDNSIGVIVNKMGVNHPIKDEPYKSFNEEKLLIWYDKCFLMMIHAIRTSEISKIKNERKQLLNNDL